MCLIVRHLVSLDCMVVSVYVCMCVHFVILSVAEVLLLIYYF